ncbi:CorA family divalent cation transporter [Sulfurovum sp.]|uniref:CorA family divalent cation transporter n=1 Tax=Sulfurovum sp. TaxID=1969726 RepID=UPI00356450DC
MEHFEQFLDSLHLEDLNNAAHPSIFDKNEEYDMLIVRLPFIGEKLEAQSIGFIIEGRNSFLYNRDKKKFELLEDRFLGPYKIIDPIIDTLLKSFEKYRSIIVDMEELLYENMNIENFMADWIGLKRDILLIQRVLTRTSEMLLVMVNHYRGTTDFPMNHYEDMHEHIERIMHSATHQLSKLDYLYNFYSARSNDKMNKMIYILTIISAIFLPLNLLVGFFGMNTSGLPFTSSEQTGTLNVVFLMFSLVILTLIAVLIWHKKTQRGLQ